MKQLMLVEGLPGTGKTTATQYLYDHLVAQRERAIALFEGDERIPCDFYETAGIPIGEFDAFCAEHEDIADALRSMSVRTANYAYLRLDKCADFVAESFRRWDMGDERNQQVSVAHYIPCALERLDLWVAANLSNQDTVIIDSGFLQNPINELLFRKATDAEVRAFILGILDRITPLNPVCFYLKRENAEEAISFAKQAKGQGWASRVDAMLEELGCPNLFAHRFDLELSLLPSIPHVICTVQDTDWTDIDRQAQRMLEPHFIQ